MRHEYPRWAEQDQPFTVKVKTYGPGCCAAESSVNIVVDGAPVCPIISRIDTYTASETETTVSIGFIPFTIQGVPKSWEWDFGDGSQKVTTSDPEVIHAYSRSAGSGIEVKVSATGPGNCSAKQSVELSVDGSTPCPELGPLKLSGRMSNGYYLVSASLTLNAGSANGYRWDWGDGSDSEETTGPSATHEYALADQDYPVTVTVTAGGPGSCESDASETITIPAETVKHPWCRWWPLLVAFLAALAGGAWLVCPAAQAEGSAAGWVYWVLLILILGFGATVWLWQSLGKKRNCPPDLCNGLAVGWSMMLTMTGVAFFLNDCLPNWMVWGIGSLVLAAGLAGWWFARCARYAGSGRFLAFFLVSLLAFAAVVLAIAMPALSCV